MNLWSLIFGLTLNGMLTGFTVENRNVVYEISWAYSSERMIALRFPFEDFVRTARYYQPGSESRVDFNLKSFVKDDFEFLGAPWKWGLGGGLKASVLNGYVQLVDSSYLSNVQRFKFVPQMSLFFNVYTSQNRLSGISTRMDLGFEPELAIVFTMGL